ncbi:MAG: NirD/YgiW/YdeI family stress tolerance protein [Deltaproteobacteria bacterium]|jgi:uncharacterized protein (TIGR00156 family)|nr:NirD/YgiW/YdeI family stress tolerance protein [Deltaproteobacteria bacterium]
MRRIRFSSVLPALMIAALAFPAAAFAQGGFQAPDSTAQVQSQGGGFTGPGGQVVTIEQAKQMRDDTPVSISGKIVQRLGGEKYIFLDGTADVVVEIDDDDWGGVNATPQTTLILHGEVDRDWTGITIDVDRVELVQ